MKVPRSVRKGVPAKPQTWLYRLLLGFILTLNVAPGAALGGPSLSATPGAIGLGDPYYPAMGNSGYDVLHYTLDLDLDVTGGTMLDAVATIEAVATQDLASFNFDYRGPAISSVTVDDQPADYDRADGELTMTPDAPIADGDPFTVVVTYAGRPERVNDPLREGWWTAEDEIFIAGEPSGAEAWYPVNAHPLDKATYTIQLTVPKPFGAVANGRLARVTRDDATTTFRWESPDPMASYLVTFHAARLEVERLSGPRGLPITNYFPTGTPAYQRAPFARTPEMIAYFETVFGPYPFTSFGGTIVNGQFGAALETQTMVIYGPFSVTESTIAHELAHQWFGDSVTLERWHDIWLNEGFATYAEVLWLEHTDGIAARDRYLRDLQTRLAREIAGNPAAAVIVGDPGPNRLFDPSVYGRGALTLHALRLEVGDADFFAILQTWTSRYRHANATTADFIALSEEISGHELADLFDGWLYQPALPDLAIVTRE